MHSTSEAEPSRDVAICRKTCVKSLRVHFSRSLRRPLSNLWLPATLKRMRFLRAAHFVVASSLACESFLPNTSGGEDAGMTDSSMLMDASAEDVSVQDALTDGPIVNDPLYCAKGPAMGGKCRNLGQCGVQILTTSFVTSTANYRYPHDVALSGPYLHFSAQVDTTPGRNRDGVGVLMRIPRAGGSAVPLTVELDAPGRIAFAINGDMYFTSVAARTPSVTSSLKMIAAGELDACAKMSTTCVGTVLTTQGGRITSIVPLADGQVYFRTDESKLYLLKEEGSVPIAVNLPNVPGARDVVSLGGSPRVLSYVNGAGAVYDLADVTSTQRLSWMGEPQNPYLFAGCAQAYVLNTNQGLPIFSANGSSLRQLPCNDGGSCASEVRRLVFAGAVDADFIYVGRPNGGGGVLRMDRNTGGTRLLPLPAGAIGDIWDVSNDDEAVYYADVDGQMIGRTLKQ